MVIMPVSGIDATSSVNRYTSFGHRKSAVDDIPSMPEHRGANNLAKVPVVVLMAMSPAMINAGQPKTNLETEVPAKTEMVAAPSSLDMEALDELTAVYPGVEEMQQSDDGRSVVMGNKKFREFERIVNIEGFMSGSQKKYMVFAGYKSNDPNTVYKVHIVPKNNKNTELFLPEVTELIYHDLGPGKEFCSVKVRYWFKNEQGHYEHVCKDERIPDDTANNLLAFLANDTKYKNNTHINATKTKSAALQPDEYKW